MGKSRKATPMTNAAVARIQSHADRTGRNQAFKARVQRIVAKREK